jgi:hypothetical protein
MNDPWENLCCALRELFLVICDELRIPELVNWINERI